ncbi:MAG: hypothetical protein IJU03_12355 [Thermoguttaceae bacterium]|nr:hypothetical protein [Thermoguttaceae bacterium]
MFSHIMAQVHKVITIVSCIVLKLIKKALIFALGVGCGSFVTAIIANGEPSLISEILNQFKITRSGVRLGDSCLTAFKYPAKLEVRTYNLLETIQNEAPLIESFPVDIIVDAMQLDVEYACNQGRFGISSTPDRIVGRTKDNRVNVDLSLDASSFTDSKVSIFELSLMNRRYDLTYERFLHFYKFYLSALNATEEQVDECIVSFPNMTPKEKALALSAFYIYEQRARKPSRICAKRYSGKKLKYNAYRIKSHFSDEKWSCLNDLLKSNLSSQEIVFEAIPNEGLIRQWETSFRRNALIYQYDLYYYNPYCYIGNDWEALCRTAPLNFLYALLWSETEELFLNSEKEFPRARLSSFPGVIELARLQNHDQAKGVEEEYVVRPISSEEKKYRTIIYYRKYLGGDESISSGHIITMREYLNTQRSFVRNYYPDPTPSLRDSGFIKFGYDKSNPIQAKELSSVKPFNANTSYEPKTLGFIASTLLHSRGLFDDAE